jgi:hypothetical protein
MNKYSIVIDFNSAEEISEDSLRSMQVLCLMQVDRKRLESALWQNEAVAYAKHLDGVNIKLE